MDDRGLMSVALRHARLGAGKVNPNPMVGAVIVRDGAIIATGHHDHFGGWHAERAALEAAERDGVDVRGATIYVTLEPCCHTGKQPPCTQALIDAGIARVVVGSPDPNPLVAGKGVRRLIDAGIEVTQGVLREECDALNEMVGVGTVVADNPRLTCRIPGGHDPIRVVCDTDLNTPRDTAVVATARETPTIIVTCSTDETRARAYRDSGGEILHVPADDNGHVSVAAVVRTLGGRGVDSVMIEGGGELAWSALRDQVVTKVSTYVAPKLFGGRAAPGPVGGAGVGAPDDAFLLAHRTVAAVGDDIVIEGGVDYVHRNR